MNFALNPHVRWDKKSARFRQRPWKSGFPWVRTCGAIALFVAIFLLTGCVQTETVRKLPDGGEERQRSWGLTDRAGRIVERGSNYYFRVPQVERGSK